MMLTVQISETTTKSHGDSHTKLCFLWPILFRFYDMEVLLFQAWRGKLVLQIADENFIFVCTREWQKTIQELWGGAEEGREESGWMGWRGVRGVSYKINSFVDFWLSCFGKLDTVSNVTEYTTNQETLKLPKRVIMKDGNWEVANSHYIHILPSYSHIFRHPVVVD